MSFVRFWRARLAVVLLIAAGLASCYVPDDFKAEIRVASNGDFAMSYEGILTWAPLYSDIKDGKLAPADIPAKIALFEEDLRRDTNFKEIKSIGKGRYQVRYERSGHLKGSEMVSFIRRNALILYIKPTPDGTATIAANMPKGERMENLLAMGLEIKGILRVSTGVQALRGNADKVKDHGTYKTYDWHINRGTKAAPTIVLKLGT